MRRRRFNLMPFVVLFGGAIAWAGDSLPGSVHTPFLFNRTGGPADVRMTWVLRRVPCATTPEALAATLGPSDLDDQLTVTLDSGEVATLSGPPAAGTSPVGVCAGPDQPGNYPDPDCRAAILQTAGAAPVLMVAPKYWQVDGGDDALSLVSHAGALVFQVANPGGPGDRSIRIAPVDPAAIAARPATTDGCRQARDAYRVLEQSTACASDSDCQALPGVPIQGEAGSCTLFVNQAVTPAAVAAVKAQWAAGLCATAEAGCRAPLGVVCRAGACAELCAGVALPNCDTSCDAYAAEPNGVCSTY